MRWRQTRPGAPWAALAALVLLVVLAGTGRSREAASAESMVKSAPRLQVSAGKSIIINCDADIHRVSVAQPKTADFVVVAKRQVYVTGQEPGVTTLTIWDKSDRVRQVYDLEVAPDVSRLKKQLHDLMPNETGIQVLSAKDSIALSGVVSSPENLAKAISLAEMYVQKKEQVVNLMNIGGVQQVMLEVRVAEMSKSLVNKMGINFNTIWDGDFVYSLLGGMTALDPETLNLVSPEMKYWYVADSAGTTLLPLWQYATKEFYPKTESWTLSRDPAKTPSTASAMRFNTNWGSLGNTTWTAFIDILKNNGVIKVLAEPTLACLSGQSASFQAGGELPIPVPSGLGTVGIEYKKYGVMLDFKPQVLGDKISLVVHPTVSEPDTTNAIVVQGFQIPSIKTRTAQTAIEIKDGQSFAIGGLLQTASRDGVLKYPILGDIPVLGNLFKSSEFQKNESELVIIITARLAKPLDKKNIKLPTDTYHEPDDMEFFLGMKSDKDKGQTTEVAGLSAGRGGLDGEFGHLPPALPRARELQQ